MTPQVMFFSYSLTNYFYGFLRDFNGFHSKKSESQIIKLAYVARHSPQHLKLLKSVITPKLQSCGED